MSLLPANGEPCQVCGQKAHGVHFGAVTCRACSAFFRRAASGTNFAIKCREGGDDCEISLEGRLCCKKCRLKKCKDVGMDISKFQFNRDLISSSKKVPPSFANYLGRPEFLVPCDPGTASSSEPRVFLDFSSILDKTSTVFRQGALPTCPMQSRLEKMTLGLKNTREMDEREARPVTRVGVEQCMRFWEYDMLATAKWLTHFDEFQQLDHEKKMDFVKCTWHVWNRLEKLARTSFIRTHRDPRAVIVSGNDDVVLSDLQLDLSWLTSYSVDQIAYFLDGFGDWSSWELLPPLIDLNPSDMELNYMLAQICFEYADKHFQGEMATTCERLQEVLADELHNYYVNDLGLRVYSERIVKMMKVNNLIRKYMWEKQEKITLAKTFDVFAARVSNPEMFLGIL